MTPPSFVEMLQTLIILAKTIAGNHMNHEQRDTRLSVVRGMIAGFINQHNRSDWYTSSDPLIEKCVLRALYDLSIWHRDHETHRDVKQRMRLFIEVASYGLDQTPQPEKSVSDSTGIPF